MTWINDIIEAHKEVESPRNFWMWAALAAISAVVKDNVYLNRADHYTLYPNIFVMLYADSGLKKGAPISFARDLVKRVNNTRIIYGRSSIQGILKELGSPAYTQPGGRIINDTSVGFYCASEFAASMVKDDASMKILTDLYDRHWNSGEWKQLLKMEQFTLTDPMLTMLVATNEAMTNGFIGESEYRGGFFGRTFIIHEKEGNTINPLIYPIKNPPDKVKLAEYLNKLSNLKGDFYPSLFDRATGEPTRAGQFYLEWYNNFELTRRQSEIEDKTGTMSRFGDSVLKIAMLLSLAKRPEIEITEETMQEAVNEGEKLIGNVRRASVTEGSREKYAAQKAVIIRELVNRDTHTISRKQLMMKFTYYFNASELDEILLSLEQAGAVHLEIQGNQQMIVMSGATAEKFKRFFSGKDK